jgi:hypothetical protein
MFVFRILASSVETFIPLICRQSGCRAKLVHTAPSACYILVPAAITIPAECYPKVFSAFIISPNIILGQKIEVCYRISFPFHFPSPYVHTTFYPQTMALASPRSGGRSVGIVRSRIHATEFVFLYVHTMPQFRNPLFIFH